MRWSAAVAGVAAFVLAHVVTVQAWSAWAGTYDPWFLNSGKAVLLTVVICAAAAAAVAGLNRKGRFVEAGVLTGVGAFAASLAVLFWRGAGSIFPIVIVVDALVLFASAMAGAGLVGLARHS